jgi:hypothetical protein
MTEQTDAAEPLIVAAIRRRPNGFVHHSAEGAGGTGTTAAGFLRELDDYIAAREAAARAEAWDAAIDWATACVDDDAREANPYRIARTDGAGS